MLGRLAGATLILLLAWSGTAQALGLGDIRLESALNEPFRAEIELLSVTPEELEGLTVRLAPTETFRRYGIDRPPFLSSFRFEIRPLPGNRGLVRVTSREPVTEPFVTFLAEATWPRGRLLREYTVLLNPPTFAGGENDAGQQAAPVQAPADSSARRADAGSIRRAPEPGQRAAPALGSGDTYRVQRNETLWGIAERVRPAGSGLTMNQVMVALYENNPEAFDGNINYLREGAVLRVPSEDAMYGINRSDAVAEVSRQNQAWRGGESAGSLRLVPPDGEPGATAGPTPAADARGTAAPGAGAGEAERVRRLEAELAERERQLAIRDQELAALRQQLATLQESAEPAPTPVEDEEPGAVAPGVDLEAEGEAAADDGEIFAETEPADAEEAGEEPVPAAAEPAAEETAPERTTPAVVTTQPEEDGGIMGMLGGLLGSIWTYVGLGVVVVGLLLLMLARRRGGEAEDSTGTWEALDEVDDDEEREATERLRALASDDDSFVVVEKEAEPEDAGVAAAAGAAAAGAAAAAADERSDAGVSSSYSLEDTFSSETAINLDQSDPLAEADFHMAYGLYDQAADLIRNAIAADPDRADLRAKLAEVYFVWGNKDAFVDAAENLHDALGGEGGEKGSDWDKIVIMGRQIAPEHELFEGAAAAGGGDVDLSFDEESGVGTLDVDFGSEEGGEFDLSFDGDADSGEADLEGTSGGLDFVLDETGERTGTNEMLLDPTDLAETGEYQASAGEYGAEEPTEESPTLETPYDEDTQESPTLETPFEEEDTRESPTLETPAGEDADDEITQETPTIEAWAGEAATELPLSSEEEQRRSEQTAEIDLDDLGLDLPGIGESDERSATVLHFQEEDLADDEDESGEDLRDRTGETHVLGDEEATMLAPGGAGADEPVGADESGDARRGEQLGDDEATTLAPATDPDFAETEALDQEASDSAETGVMPGLGGEDVDLDLDDLTAAIKQSDLGDLETPRDEDDTVEQPGSTDATGRFSADVFDDDELDSILDLDVGEDLADEDDAPTDTALEGSGEGRTQTEVGTKLDLARAYVDMGDPEGARSILQEVLEEGDEGQRQEANRLLDALPG